jgi:hypothetical protein
VSKAEQPIGTVFALVGVDDALGKFCEGIIVLRTETAGLEPDGPRTVMMPRLDGRHQESW